MKHNNKFFVLALFLYIIGLFIVCYFSNWQTCLGVIIMMWANNLEQTYKHDNKKHNRHGLFWPNVLHS